MKLLTTKKTIKNNYDIIISVGAGQLQSLLNAIEPFGYSIRVEGWACDYYDINGICICTGYSPITGKTIINPDYATCKKYDDLAKIVLSQETDFETIAKKLDSLIREFLQEVGATRE